MGLIKKGYKIEELDITISEVYAKVEVISTERKGNTFAILQIRKSKDEFIDRTMQPLKTVTVLFDANKNLPLWEQAYNEAKKSDEFKDWEDDFNTK